MKVAVGDRWEHFVVTMVEQGRYGSPNEVVREGLRLVEEREAKFRALGWSIDAFPARSGPSTAKAAPGGKPGDTIKDRR